MSYIPKISVNVHSLGKFPLIQSERVLLILKMLLNSFLPGQLLISLAYWFCYTKIQYSKEGLRTYIKEQKP